jgi:hypothetical protein
MLATYYPPLRTKLRSNEQQEIVDDASRESVLIAVEHNMGGNHLII